MSDAKLAVKVALQKAGIAPAPARMIVQVSGDLPIDHPPYPSRAEVPHGSPAGASDSLRANLDHDTEAADIASAQLPGHQENEIEHALDIAGAGVDDEGKNLIGDKPES
jgi:hypothetical protein